VRQNRKNATALLSVVERINDIRCSTKVGSHNCL